MANKKKIKGLEEYVNGTPPLINIILSDSVNQILFESLRINEVKRCLNLLSLFEKIDPSTDEIILYRGLGESNVIDKSFYSQTLLSSSPSKEYASLYCSDISKQILEIIVPPGIKIINPNNYDICNYDIGDEMILPPGNIIPINKYTEIIENDEVTIIVCKYENVPNSLLEASNKIQNFIKLLNSKE